MTYKIKLFLAAFKFYIYNSLVTNIPSYKVRHAYLRSILGIKIGKNSAIHMGCFITGYNIEIGDYSVINRNTYLDGRGVGIIIKDNVNISPEVYILSLTHNVNEPHFNTVSKEVIIEDYAWIGARAMIMPGTVIGKGAVLGALSFTNKILDAYGIYAGVPAKKNAGRSRDLKYKISYFPLFNTDISL